MASAATTTDLLIATLVTAAFLATDHDLTAARKWRRIGAEAIVARQVRVSRGSLPRRIAFVGLAAVGLLSLKAAGPREWGERWVSAPVDRIWAVLLIAYLLWPLATVLWASDRRLTLRRLFAWAAVCLPAVGLAGSLPFSSCAGLVATCSLAFLLIGISTESALGTLWSRPKPRFAGTLHPNQQGVNCAFLVLCSGYLLVAGGTAAWLATGSLLLGAAFLLLTRSRGAVWGTGIALATASLGSRGLSGSAATDTRVLSWPGLVWIAAAAACLLVAARHLRLPSGWVAHAVLLGRRSPATATLTGRIPVWRYAVEAAGARIVWGMGFGSFWDAARVREVSDRVGWRYSDSHSAYVDWLLGAGLVGLLLFAGLLGISLREALASSGHQGALLAGMVTFVIVQAVVESTFALPNYPTFAFTLLLASAIRS